MSRIAMLYTIFADAEEADRIARMVVEERLAACANIVGPCRSIYRWDETVQTTEEVIALFKTREDVADRLAARIAALHSYDVPAITRWHAETHTPYADWASFQVL